jgi:Zn-dependent protease with chaperone function
MYYRLGLCLALAAFFVVNAVASTIVALLLPRLARGRSDGRAAAQRLFLIRLVPTLAALLVAAAVVAPSYLLFEPESSHETPGPFLQLLSLGGLTLLAAGAVRGLAALRATRRVLSSWLASSQDIRAVDGAPGRVRLLRSPLPIVSLVGVRQAWTFVSDRVVATLNERELAAALAHETGHHTSRDNLKRLVLSASPDLLAFYPAGRLLDRAWLHAAESAADDYAASNEQSSLDLASALVKVSRLLTARLEPASALLGDGEGIRWRVERLLTPRPTGSATTTPYPRTLLVGALLLPAVTVVPALLALVHGLSEILVNTLR